MSFWDTSRKRRRRCPACLASIEFTVPALPYYSYVTVVVLFWTVAPILLLYLAFIGRWQWGMAAAVAGFLMISLANLLFSPILVARREGDLDPAEVDYQRRFPG